MAPSRPRGTRTRGYRTLGACRCLTPGGDRLLPFEALHTIARMVGRLEVWLLKSGLALNR